MNLRRNRFLTRSLQALSPLVVLALFSALANGQPTRQRQDRFKPPETTQTADDSQNPTNIIVSPREDHRIGSGDVLDIQVNMAPELTSVVRVGSDGAILMPYLGRVQAKNKTSDQLSVELADKLRGEYLKNPIVKIVIKQIYSHNYYIQGAVRRSGVYQVEGRPTLLEMLTVGGGLIDNHGTTAFVIRRMKSKTEDAAEEGQTAEATPAVSPTSAKELVKAAGDDSSVYELHKANIAGLLRGNFEQNLLLEPGDIVNIPPSDVFFVAGAVREPGAFLLKDGATLRQAISLAQGVTIKAAGNRAIIYRDAGGGNRQEIKVDVDAVMKGKADDIALLPNDTVVIPNSGFKSAAIPALSTFGNGLSFGIGTRLP